MEVRSLGLDGVFEIIPRKFGDDRGFFSETYNAKSFAEAGIDLQFVQDNHSFRQRRAWCAVFITSCRRGRRTSSSA